MQPDAAGVLLPRRPPLWVIVAISALQPIALNVLAPASPGLARTLQTDYPTIQLTLTLYLLAVALVQPIVGPISDRIGRRPCILAGIGLFAVGCVIGYFSPTIEVLLAARIVQAIGGGTAFALTRAVIRDIASKNEAASLIGYVTMAMVIAPMVSPLAGSFLDVHYGWRSIFVALGIATVAVGLAAWWLLHETRRPGAGAPTPGVARSPAALLGDRRFLGYVGGLAFTSVSFFAFVAGAPYFIVEVLGHDPRVYGGWFAVSAAGYMLGNFLSGRFGTALGADRLILFGTALSCIAMAIEGLCLVLLPWTPASFFLPLVINGIGQGMTIPGGSASALSVRPDLAGTAAGLMGAAQLGLGAAGTVLAGYVVVLWPPGLVVVMAVSVFVGGLLFLIARN